ncbi:MAG: hypothetical protein JNK90_03735 [Planctomycetaceae bacterium]|nr:hypothetical protein [Planctomycetaceae bacterium]
MTRQKFNDDLEIGHVSKWQHYVATNHHPLRRAQTANHRKPLPRLDLQPQNTRPKSTAR